MWAGVGCGVSNKVKISCSCKLVLMHIHLLRAVENEDGAESLGCAQNPQRLKLEVNVPVV